MNDLDPRLVEVLVEVGANVHRFTGELAIRAQGMLFANPLNDICDVTIYNLDRQTQDYLLNATSPYSAIHEPKSVTVSAGRKSYGVSQIYRGSIVVSSATQPPDIGVTFSCMSGVSFNNVIYNVNAAGTSTLVEAVKRLADRLNARSQIELTNPPSISNYTFNGTASGELAYLNSFGNITAFLVEGETNILYVKGSRVPLANTLRVVSEDTGMIGVPEWTELGIKVTFLIDKKTQIGGAIRIVSHRYPAFNGDYYIFKLGFSLASRDTPFYYIAEAARYSLSPNQGIVLPSDGA